MTEENKEGKVCSKCGQPLKKKEVEDLLSPTLGPMEV